MPASDIVIKGAREHNLRDVNLRLPRNKLICLTGVSGSGKSSLAFDTLFAEGQRRYVESLSTFARQFLGQMQKPDVDHISGLSPSISISQKSSGSNPRSTVGTITEIYDFLRVLYARVGQGHCYNCGRPITAQSREQILGRILTLPAGAKFMVMAPVVRRQKGAFQDLFEDLQKRGFVRARVDGEVVELASSPTLDRQMRHDIEVVIDRLLAGPTIRGRLAEAVDLGLSIGKGSLVVAPEGDAQLEEAPPAEAGGSPKGKNAASRDMVLSSDFACTPCGLSFEPPTPQLFSFNSPQGMCDQCDGLGEFYSFDPELLVTDPSKSLAQGCIELVGTWKDLSKWKRHIFQGVASTLEKRIGLEEGFLLETAWEELAPELQEVWLWGAGDEHITFTWKTGRSAQKYGGHFAGIIPELLEKHRSSSSKPQVQKLEQCMRQIECPACNGSRLNPQARAVKITTASEAFETKALGLPEVCGLPISIATEFFKELVFTDSQHYIAAEALKEIRGRLGFLSNVGLEYLSLDRTAPTLSGGESQRIRLASQIGCGLVGVLYVLDEPSIGLHSRDNRRLLDTLERLRDMGNTVIVVEHDEETMRTADWIIDLGPGAGINGGLVVAAGTPEQITANPHSLTGRYMAGDLIVSSPNGKRRPTNGKWISLVGARQNNLKNLTTRFPLGLFTCVTGVSGSGKSSLVAQTLQPALSAALHRAETKPGAHDALEGLEHVDKVINITQEPIGRTPRSNPATYVNVMPLIRDLFALTPEAKARGYKPGRFSFNVKGGRCEACRGHGQKLVEMHFLPDVWITCNVCKGSRFNQETLQVRYKAKNISEVLGMDVNEALEFFGNVPGVRRILQTLSDVGLGYIKLGQSAITLSGGEAQRVKLAKELARVSTGDTIYILDEPTTGLHFADIQNLLDVLHRLTDAGNTVIVIEHNLDVIKTADWVIDLGPEGGDAGGYIVAQGTPEEVAQVEESFTGQFLRKMLVSQLA